MLSHEKRMLHEMYDIKMHACAWAWACRLRIPIVGMCLETQFGAASPKMTPVRGDLDQELGA